MTHIRSVSVVISTNGRAASLAKTLAALSWQTYRHFEVCVVTGPQRDGTHDLVAHYVGTGRIKSAPCEAANLSRSRNIGIRLAAGDLIAFIDDDAIPEPVWLERLVEAFSDPGVAAASGLVYAPDSRTHQFCYGVCDRHGEADHAFTEPADSHAVPYAVRFPHAMGTNSMFRRDALVRIGGFDEEYEYYLDETDVCCRLIDAGAGFRQISNAPVHHKFLPGTVRNAAREETRHFPIVKNRIYFALVNDAGHNSLSERLARALHFIEKRRQSVITAIAAGRRDGAILQAFDAEIDDAWRVGLSRGLAGTRRCPDPATFSAPPPFRLFPTEAPDPAGTRPHVLVLLPSRRGNAEVFAAAMQRIAARRASGAFVRAVSFVGGPSTEAEGVDVSEQGVWLERIVAVNSRPRPSPIDLEIDEAAWQRATAFADLVRRIDPCHPIDAIEDWTGRADSVALILGRDSRVWIGAIPGDAQNVTPRSALARLRDWQARPVDVPDVRRTL